MRRLWPIDPDRAWRRGKNGAVGGREEPDLLLAAASAPRLTAARWACQWRRGKNAALDADAEAARTGAAAVRLRPERPGSAQLLLLLLLLPLAPCASGRPTESRRGSTASERPGEGACAAEEPLPLEGRLFDWAGPSSPSSSSSLSAKTSSKLSFGRPRVLTGAYSSSSSAWRVRPLVRRGVRRACPAAMLRQSARVAAVDHLHRVRGPGRGGERGRRGVLLR